jgi:hypothetical protein
MAKNNRSNIPEKLRYFLWAKSAGRCHICNQLVYQDWLTFEELNLADVAHIIGSSPDGPRGDDDKSKELDANQDNLMLLCKVHHKLIDEPDFEKDYPVDRLLEIKRAHEERIELLTSISGENRTHVLLYSANIGQQTNPVSFERVKPALVNQGKFPAESRPITLNLAGSYMTDERAQFWVQERENLRHAFDTQIRNRIGRGEILHLSLFALAPIPLLIELGSLLTDKTAVDVYQLLREPSGWSWQTDADDSFDYIIKEPSDLSKSNVALVLSLSGTIPEKDIFDTLGADTAVWEMTIPNVHNDFLRTKEQLALFRRHFRKLLNRIKEKHGRHAVINLFPATPVAIAIEIGRVWMPKADLSILIFDRNHSDRRFSHSFNIETT